MATKRKAPQPVRSPGMAVKMSAAPSPRAFAVEMATMLGGLAALLCIVIFVTGKSSLPEFFRQRPNSSRPSLGTVLPLVSDVASPVDGGKPSIEKIAPNPPSASLQPIDLHSILEIASTSSRLTQVQKTKLRRQFDKKRVILEGYLASVEYSGLFGTSAEISIKPNAEQRLGLWIDKSSVEAFSNLDKGSFVRIETTLWSPIAGNIVGKETRLVSASPAAR